MSIVQSGSLRSPSLQFPAGVETAVRRMKIIQRVPLNHTLHTDTQHSIFRFSNFKLHMYIHRAVFSSDPNDVHPLFMEG